MSNKTVIVIAVIAFVLLGGYFLLRGGYQQPAPSVTQPASPQPITQPPVSKPSVPEQPSAQQPPASQTPVVKENVVTYTDSGYSPNALTIKQGETVTFKNQSSRSMWPASAVHPTHTVYSGTSLSQHCPDTAGAAFDACKGFLPGQSWSFTFKKAGNWKYHDHLNPGSTGEIQVK